MNSTTYRYRRSELISPSPPSSSPWSRANPSPPAPIASRSSIRICTLKLFPRQRRENLLPGPALPKRTRATSRRYGRCEYIIISRRIDVYCLPQWFLFKVWDTSDEWLIQSEVDQVGLTVSEKTSETYEGHGYPRAGGTSIHWKIVEYNGQYSKYVIHVVRYRVTEN